MLLDFGCTAAQGWHYGKAMPPDRLSQRLRGFEPPLIPDLAFERDVARR
jgi:EAL domain-containing protein (putative c-di-GMP-specific phosphodiesterase class I)